MIYKPPEHRYEPTHTEPSQPSRWHGDFRPFRPRRRGIPIISDKMLIGKDGRYFSQIKFWVYGPQPDYPTTAVNISLNNSAGSAFTTVTPEELHNLILQLTQWEAELLVALPKLQEDAKRVQAAREAMDRTLNVLRAAGVTSEPEDMYDDTYEEPTPEELAAQQTLFEGMRQRFTQPPAQSQTG